VEPHPAGRHLGWLALPTYYLDTSAQIGRRSGRSQRQLKALLADGGHSTSSLVLREWNRIVFGAVTKLRNALERHDDWQAVVDELTNEWGDRGVSHNWIVLSWLEGRDGANRALIEMRIERFERSQLDEMFHNGVAVVRDQTCCGVARRRPTFAGGQWKYNPMCRKTDDICCQPSFFEAQRERAESAAVALTSSTRERDEAMGKRALGTLSDTKANATKGRNCHDGNGLGGDIGIALECGEEEILVTTDHSFDLICPAIDIRHERIQSS
jgi:hypothetical protein